MIQIRLIQLKRIILGLPPLYSAAVMMAAAISLLGIWQSENAYGIAGIMASVILLFQIKRNDRALLDLLSTRPYYIRWKEYLLITSPVAIIFLVKVWITPLIIYIIITGIISCINFSHSPAKGYLHLGVLVPARAIEWKSGLRDQELLFTILFSGAIFCCRIAYVSYVFTILTTLLICNFYNWGESLEILMIQGEKPWQIVRKKIRDAVLLSFPIYMLPILLSLVFNPQTWAAALLCLIIAESGMLFAVTSKYGGYLPNSGIQQQAMGYLGLFFPPFLPLTWLMTVYYTLKINSRLNEYLRN